MKVGSYTSERERGEVKALGIHFDNSCRALEAVRYGKISIKSKSRHNLNENTSTWSYFQATILYSATPCHQHLHSPHNANASSILFLIIS